MKVFASTLAAFAIGQESSDKWTGFDYDYGFGDNTNLQKNQVSQSAVGNTAWAQQTDTPSLNAVQSALDSANLQTIYNFHGASVTGFDGKDFHKMELGNGRMCWFCDSDSVYNCFKFGKFQTCRGQDYFCFYHERRRIGHYFNRREKYIDNHESTNIDLFLVRTNNEAWNVDQNGMPNSKDGKFSDTAHGTDNFRPATDIHVLAGCQQPEACLRQQAQNQALNMGIAFYGDDATAEIGNIQGGTDFQTYIHPTSRRNVREGLCRLGKDWTYYSGKLWHYDNQGVINVGAGRNQISTIADINNTPIETTDTSLGIVDTHSTTTAEATGVFGRDGSNGSSLLWGRGIYDAHDTHGHQFWHERESWYNGMRPNGFPDNHYHGGKGTESVCHFCCNPTSSDGMFCNRKMLDGSTTNQYALDASGKQMGLQFSDGTGFWFNVDSNPGTDGADARNAFLDEEFVRADNPNLKLMESPMANSYNTGAAWLSKHRYHGMFRNPNTQISQDFMDPYFA